MDLLGLGLGVVLEEDVARADRDVGALAVEVEDLAALDLEHRVAQGAVVAAVEQREVGDRVDLAVVGVAGCA